MYRMESKLCSSIGVRLVVVNVYRFFRIDVVAVHQDAVDCMVRFEQLLITGDHQSVEFLHEVIPVVSHREGFM